MSNRPLTGIKVIELATFVAAPSATRFLADQGADVIKIESISGDNLRYCAATDGIPDDPYENVTFDVENGNKRSISLNLKNPAGFEILMKLLSDADVFITNWRPQALEKSKLSYEQLKEQFPKLVYGAVTGYGDVGPDKDLPGYDATAFFARSGFLGSVYEKGTVPINLIPSVGDRQTGMCLAAGVLAALYQSRETGKGDYVSVSLMATSIFMQATLIQSAQYGKIKFPITKREMLNPLMSCYKTKEGRFIQLALPVYDIFMPGFAKAMSHEEWIQDPRFRNVAALQNGHTGEFYDSVSERFSELTVEEIKEILTKANIPFSLAQEWDEVLKDPQAWATDCFCEKDYPSGKRVVVRNPVRFKEAGLPDYNCGPQLGENSAEILSQIGYSDTEIKNLKSQGIIHM